MKNIILDFGHGGIDKNGNYTTAPAKMYKFSNGEVAYEGFLNRQIGGLVELYLRSKHPAFNVVTTVKATDPRDLSLPYRVKIANQFPAKETIFISIHSNASKGHNASGFSIFTTKGLTLSDHLATSIGEEVKKYYDKLNLRLRFDFSDGDLDKEKTFTYLEKRNVRPYCWNVSFLIITMIINFLKNRNSRKNLPGTYTEV